MKIGPIQDDPGIHFAAIVTLDWERLLDSRPFQIWESGRKKRMDWESQSTPARYRRELVLVKARFRHMYVVRMVKSYDLARYAK